MEHDALHRRLALATDLLRRVRPDVHPNCFQLQDDIDQFLDSAVIPDGVMVLLPDGSGCCVESRPLPATHWLTVPGDNKPPKRHALEYHDRLIEDVRAAARYALRTATGNGTQPDLDPDALVQNLVFALFGPGSGVRRAGEAR